MKSGPSSSSSEERGVQSERLPCARVVALWQFDLRRASVDGRLRRNRLYCQRRGHARSEFRELAVTTAPTTPGGTGNLEVESLLIEGEAVLRLRGELDMDSASMFAEAARLVLVHEIPTLVLDLSDLDFIDSSGLREFVVAFKRQREIGGDLVLRAPTTQVRRVLDIVGLSEMVTMAEAAAPPLATGPGQSDASSS